MTDSLDLSTASVVNSPSDIASWPITTTITRVTMRRPEGLSFETTPPLPEAWKWFSNPARPTDHYQCTVWLCAQLNGHWVTSGFIQMWQGRDGTGAPILSDFRKNWAYDARWGPLTDYTPQPGDRLGFFLSAGNARGVSGVTSVRERSNVVVCPLPAGDVGVFDFTAAPALPGDPSPGDGSPTLPPSGSPPAPPAPPSLSPDDAIHQLFAQQAVMIDGNAKILALLGAHDRYLREQVRLAKAALTLIPWPGYQGVTTGKLLTLLPFPVPVIPKDK